MLRGCVAVVYRHRVQVLRVRVRSILERHYVVFLFPARIDVSAERKLEP